MRAAVIVLLLVLVGGAVASVARAQTLEASGGIAATGPAGSLALLGMREGNTASDLRFSVRAAAEAPLHGTLNARVARSATLGLVGAATVELDLSFRTDGAAAMHIAGQGVLGPAAVRLVAGWQGVRPEAFTPSGLAPFAGVPRLVAPAFVLDATVRYRIDGSLLLTLEPTTTIGPSGIGARLRGSLRARRLWNEFDGFVAWHAWSHPEGAALGAAVGAGVVHAPRRAPEWQVAVWIGGASEGFAPGATVRGSAVLGADASLAIDLAAEPFREDVPPYRGAVELTVPLEHVTTFAAAELQGGFRQDAFGAAFRAGARIDLAGP